MALLDVKNLSISFGGLRAVDGFEMQIEKGELYGLIGPNGAGKTTVFNLLTGVYKPNEGIIKLDGEDITGKKTIDINKAGIARTFQNIRLFKQLSVLDNVKVGLHNHYKYSTLEGILRLPKYKKVEKAMDEKAMEILKVFDLDGEADVLATNLPYGKQRKLEIARALATNPKLLIADEPTTALDVTIQAQILSLLKELRDQLGIAVILITHNMGVVAAVCDRMLVMYGGAVVEEGKCTELFENPCHPYTRGLLAAIPSIKERKEKLYTIPGQVPKMKVPVQYCRFCSRCSYAQEVCHEKEPGMQGENGHLYKCFYTPQQQEKEKCGPGGGAL